MSTVIITDDQGIVSTWAFDSSRSSEIEMLKSALGIPASVVDPSQTAPIPPAVVPALAEESEMNDDSSTSQ